MNHAPRLPPCAVAAGPQCRCHSTGSRNRYERGGGDLLRFRQLLADSRDGFTRTRRADFFDLGIISLPRRGGTDLIREYTWRGIDTLSLHVDVPFDHDEIPLGWGAAGSGAMSPPRAASMAEACRATRRLRVALSVPCAPGRVPGSS